MKHKLFVGIFIILMTIANPVLGEDIFVTIGGLYGIEDFDRDLIEDIDINYNFDDAMGLNAKIGYQFTKFLAFGLDIDIIRGFEWDMTEAIPLNLQDTMNTADLLSGLLSARAEFDFITGVAFARFSMPGKYSPYVSGGLGMIRQDADVEFSASIQGYNFENPLLDEGDYLADEDICGKIGIGFEIKPIDKYSFSIEGNYTAGLGDMNDIKYTTFTAGASIYF